MKVKVRIFILCSLITLTSVVAQPPMPNAHGAWHDRLPPESPYRQLYRYDIGTGEFKPYGSLPVSTSTALIFSMACGYVGIKFYRNRRED